MNAIARKIYFSVPKMKSLLTAHRCYCNLEIPKTQMPQEHNLLQYLRNKIESTGPITVAEYMSEVLTNSQSGYYMNKDVFGADGDFITSPEISQMFGELIGVWLYNEWSRLRQPNPVQIVEFGPGRGTLADDIIRAFSKLNKDQKPVSLHLIEVSPHLKKLQKEKLGVEKSSESEDDNQEFVTKEKVPVSWHFSLDTVPKNFSLFVAHEFFDALPIHKFRKTADGWREVLIDCENTTEGDRLRFVISRNPTPSSQLLIDVNDPREELEISPQSGILINKLAARLKECGGIGLIVDYGYTNKEKGDTLRAFKKHKLHDPLLDPGSADLTADVDFSYICKHLSDLAVSVGPVSQNFFLTRMGISIRFQKLVENASAKNRKLLLSGYNMILDPSQMGDRYKVLALYPAILKDVLPLYPPPGFI